MAFRKDNKAKTGFSKISIGLASPEEILEKSSGEVLKPETINYRTYKPLPIHFQVSDSSGEVKLFAVLNMIGFPPVGFEFVLDVAAASCCRHG